MSEREVTVLAEVGGPVDELRLTLGIHGPELEPDEVSALLGCGPTASHRRGEVRRAGGRPYRAGAWLRRVEGRAPDEADGLVTRLLEGLPEDDATWTALRARFTVRVDFGVFVAGWNQGFELSPASMRRLAMFGVPIGFDIYTDGVEEETG